MGCVTNTHESEDDDYCSPLPAAYQYIDWFGTGALSHTLTRTYLVPLILDGAL